MHWSLKAAWVVLKSKATWLVASIGMIGLILLRVKNAGKQEEQIKHLENTLDALRKKEEVIREVERLPNGDAARRLLDKWSRD
jgi:hypothetical protein